MSTRYAAALETAKRCADGDRPAPPDAVRELLRVLHEYENAITWDTTCLNCSKLLDSCYEADAKREQAEEEMRKVYEICHGFLTQDSTILHPVYVKGIYKVCFVIGNAFGWH